MLLSQSSAKESLRYQPYGRAHPPRPRAAPALQLELADDQEESGPSTPASTAPSSPCSTPRAATAAFSLQRHDCGLSCEAPSPEEKHAFFAASALTLITGRGLILPACSPRWARKLGADAAQAAWRL